MVWGSRFGRRWFFLLLGALVVLAGAAVWAARPYLFSAAQTGEAARLAEALGLREGMTVAEIGAGRGDMTVQIARHLGPSGRMYSTELDPRRLEDIRRAVDRAGLENVTIVEAAERATNLPPACCDAIFMRNVYHHIEDREAFNRSVKESLTPGGVFGVIDFAPGRLFGGHGTRPPDLVREVTAAGFSVEQTVDDWFANMYLVVFRSD